MIKTKNLQSEDNIKKMAKKVFADKEVVKIKELAEGMCNVTYDISFDDGSKSILKISSKDRTGNTSNEVNLMQAEVKAMKLVEQSGACKVAQVQFYDNTRTICDGDYFFMEKLEGDNLIFVKESLSEEAINQIQKEVGEISKRLTDIKN